MSHVGDALAKYHCGPGGHKQRNLGVFFSPAQTVGRGKSIADATEPMWECEVCGIAGGFMTCIICGGDEQVSRQAIQNQEAARSAAGELCMPCYLELMGDGVGGWRLDSRS